MRNLLRRAGFWLLLPVSALQGLWLRKNALRLPEATGAKSGVSGRGEPLHLLALGDSIIAGVGTGTVERSLPVRFAEHLARTDQCQVHWCVNGANGANIADLINSIDATEEAQRADTILISIGVNNVTGLSTTRYWNNSLSTLIARLRQRWPRARVIFAGLPPMSKFPLPPQPLRFTLGLRAALLDSFIARRVAGEDNMYHVPTLIDPGEHDFCEDGFHPSAASCNFWAKELVNQTRESLNNP